MDGGVAVATHKDPSNPIDGIPTGTSGLTSSYETTLADFGNTTFNQSLANNAGNNDFGKTFPTYTTELPSVASDSRICFYPTITAEDGIGNIEVSVYIDNIRVSIAK